MGNRETSFLGAITLRILHDLPQDDAGWLIRALAEWILDDKLPDDADIPTSCLGAWIAIREESKAIHETWKIKAEAGRKGGLAKSSRRKQALAKPSKTKQTCSKPKQTEAEAYETKHLVRARSTDSGSTVDRKEDINRSPLSAVPQSRVQAREDADRIKETSFDTWAKMQDDPVSVALDVTKEPASKRGVYGKRLRVLGRERFIETVCAFRAEVEAGEVVRNRGAALTKRLNDAIEAMQAVGGLAR